MPATDVAVSTKVGGADFRNHGSVSPRVSQYYRRASETLAVETCLKKVVYAEETEGLEDRLPQVTEEVLRTVARIAARS